MDDGFKWRKYGRKSVKNSPNPRYIYIVSPLQYFICRSLPKSVNFAYIHLFGSENELASKFGN